MYSAIALSTDSRENNIPFAFGTSGRGSIVNSIFIP
jgi:hypothetical protein